MVVVDVDNGPPNPNFIHCHPNVKKDGLLNLWPTIFHAWNEMTSKLYPASKCIWHFTSNQYYKKYTSTVLSSCIHRHIYICVRARMYIYVCVHIRFIYVYVCMYVCMYVCVSLLLFGKNYKGCLPSWILFLMHAKMNFFYKKVRLSFIPESFFFLFYTISQTLE